MTDPIIDLLDQIKGRADKATEGPWGYMTNETPDGENLYFTIEDSEEEESVAETNGSYQGRADAEFIAAARTDVPRMEAALRAVLDLHKPTMMGFIVGDCAAEDCEHDDPDDCSTAPQKVCNGCFERAESVTSYAMESPFVVQSVIWPCDHAQAVADALGVETEGEE